MSRFFILSLIFLMLLGGCGPNGPKDGKDGSGDSTDLKGSLRVIGSQTLYPMMVKWSSLFVQQNKEVKIDVRGTYSDRAIRLLQNGQTDIAMISRNLTAEEKAKGLFAVPVAMDVVVAIISFDNPYIQPLVMKGVNKETLAKIFSGKIRTWGEVTGGAGKEEIKVYVQNDSTGTAHTWNAFLGLQPDDIAGTEVFTENELVNYVKSNPEGIGYCGMLNAYNLKTGLRKEGIYLLPFDLNANHNIEDNEQFFDKVSLLSNAVTSGALPSPPVRELYLVTRGKPTDPLIAGFLNWVLSVGQNYMPETGYIHITPQQATMARESMK